ncbi:MAG: hypothetical protein H8K03_14605 [Nitrospira sp.]|jgi:hypothetical protein|nr:hypothetical protein [Nitrospira sp. BO4]
MECLTVTPFIEENRMPGYRFTATGTFDRLLTGAWVGRRPPEWVEDSFRQRPW